MSAVADKLAEARKLIERGWCQGSSFQDEKGDRCGVQQAAAYCLFGALTAGRFGNIGLAAFEVLEDVVGENPITWQDKPERTQAEVIGALRKAEELARAE